MSKAIKILRKTLKVILWITAFFMLLFIGIALLIQIPSVQTKIVNYAVSFVSGKTHTLVNIKKISIAFPKSVVIEGIYLEDKNKDTLLFAGKAEINIAFNDLFNHQIHISSFSLEEVNLIINRPDKDSLFNYNFLITAFSDTSTASRALPKKKSSWAFALDNVSFKNIQFNYNDEFGGTLLLGRLKNLKLKINELNLAQSIYNIEELLVENLNASLLITKKSNIKEKQTTGVLPKITASKILVNNTDFIFQDSLGGQSLSSGINELILKDASIDLQKQIILLGNIALVNSKINYSKNPLPCSVAESVEMPTRKKSDWKVLVRKIELKDNSFAYRDEKQKEIKKVFDAAHLDYKHVSLMAADFFYSADKTETSITTFEAIDKNNFSIVKFSTDFKIDKHSICAKKLGLKTSNSIIEADLEIKYTSLQSLKDSIAFMLVNADLKNVSIRNSDILYFTPQLIQQSFFKNVFNNTTASGTVKGPINNLTGTNLILHTGINTILKTDFNIVGLPDIKTAFLYFPNLKISSGREDIKMIAGAYVPNHLELPENISMQISFKGKIKSFESTAGISSSYGQARIFADIDKKENFKSEITITNFDLGSLIKNKTMLGSLSLTAQADGNGLDKETINAKISAEVSQIYLNKYNYHHLNINGNITGKTFEGKINLADSNAAATFDGLVNLNSKQEQYKFNLDIQGADLKKLNFTAEDIRIGLTAAVDLKGGSADKLNGNAGITEIKIASRGKKYVLDSVLLASINETGKSELNISSALVGIKYKGAVSPAGLPSELNRFINNYFPFTDSVQQKKSELQNFNFEVQLHNHPIISEVLLPQLKEFSSGVINGSYDSKTDDLKISAAAKSLIYGTTEVKDLSALINSDANTLKYKISCSKIASSQIKLDNFLAEGQLADKKINTTISSIDNKQNKKLLIRTEIRKEEGSWRLSLDPKDFYLMNNRWDIAADNYIQFGKKGVLIHHLFINKKESQISISSAHDKFNDDINIAVNGFKLEEISRIIEKDTGLAEGNLDGNVLLKRVNNNYGIIADAGITNLYIRKVPIGNLSFKAENPTAERFNIDLNLLGEGNKLSANGHFIAKDSSSSISIETVIQSLSMKTIEAFSFGQITESSGDLTGNFLIEGKTMSPEITGELVFNNTFLKPAALNNLLQLKHETVQLKKDGLYFNSFTVLDAGMHTAVIDGAVKMDHFHDFVFALKASSQDFLLFNTSSENNKEYYGRMIIDSRIDLNGPMTLPVINAKIKMKKGSSFIFAVPEEKLSTDKGEAVVEFENRQKLNPILDADEKKEKTKSGFTGFDLSSIIEIDKEASLKLLLDPSSADSLIVKGNAALSFAIDRSGKMTLTGGYNINEGSYLVSLESVIKRKFTIDQGSTITWNGGPMDAEISINATYSVRASPIDLIADQMNGMSETDQNEYKQRYPFLVLLKLRGEISHPEISFEIQLPPENKGILGGAVNAKLSMVNEDPSALNKQVFALLVLGRFIQENPLQTETNGTAMAARTTVGKFLSEQLNQLSSKAVPGVELNFDVQSYDDYQTGQAAGRTQVDIGVKKKLFKEKLTVQVGGIVDVEGEKAKQNSASDITSDVTLEYKMTDDGRYRLKGFRHNQYEGAIEGSLVESGAGVLYVRDFNLWKEFFIKPKQQIDSSNKITSNDPVNIK